MARDRTRCPSCGERVMPFAAGCAVCGADLDTTRVRQRAVLVIAYLLLYVL